MSGGDGSARTRIKTSVWYPSYSNRTPCKKRFRVCKIIQDYMNVTTYLSRPALYYSMMPGPGTLAKRYDVGCLTESWLAFLRTIRHGLLHLPFPTAEYPKKSTSCAGCYLPRRLRSCRPIGTDTSAMDISNIKVPYLELFLASPISTPSFPLSSHPTTTQRLNINPITGHQSLKPYTISARLFVRRRKGGIFLHTLYMMGSATRPP